ncbi:tRNA-guanine transglycosylase [Bacillus sp. JCM 19045]|nr:tRNA-guanine transglycosylase [Bacillus sp. JCM 19045]
MKQVRQAIMDDRLLDFREQFFEAYGFNKENAKTFKVKRFKKERRINDGSRRSWFTCYIAPIYRDHCTVLFLANSSTAKATEACA